MKKNHVLVLFALLLSLGSLAQSSPSNRVFVLTSPNGINSIALYLNNGKIGYSVTRFKDTIIQKSPLGMETNQADFSQQLSFVSKKTKQINEWYTMLIGKRKMNNNKANELVIRLKNKFNKPIDLALRAYDDGVAFRYEFPQVNTSYTVTNELTAFSIPLKGKAWLMKYGMATDWSPAYEEDYTQGSTIGSASPDSSGWAFPTLFQTNNHFVLITEAGLDENFYGSHIQQDCTGGVYKIAKPLSTEARGNYSTHAVANTPFSTPWRTLIFGDNLGAIVESNLVYHLSKPNQLKEISWIKPGRSSWSWWGDHESSKNFTSLSKFIDLSKAMHWEYSLVDANWDLMKEGGDIADLARYAMQQDVSLTVWYNSGGLHNLSTERPRDILSDPTKRKIEFQKISALGIKAIKVDFFNSDKQAIIQLYLDILKDAAASKLMVIFHGCTLPRGWSRTYPNLLSMEAVKGAEQYCFDKKFYKNAPSHNTTIVAGRNVVGPMDYTPVTFSSYDSVQHASTHAHELATALLFESGMLHFADRVAAYEGLSSVIKNFLRTIPVTWDDTKLVEGYPGDYMVLARRKGNDWYIAGANGDSTPKTVKLDFSFLPQGNYQLLLMRDGATDRDIDTQIITYTKGKPMEVIMRGSGGFVIQLLKQ